MPKRSKSRPQFISNPSTHSFKTGNMLTHPNGDKIFKEQSKILQQKQKKEKDLWMLNAKPEFLNRQAQQGNQEECETDIDADPHSPKRRISRKVIEVKKKKVVVRIPYDRQADSQSEVTSGQEEETINHYKKPQERNNFQIIQNRNNIKKPQPQGKNLKKEDSLRENKNINLQVRKSPIKKVRKREPPVNRMQTSQQVLKRRGQWYEPTQRKKSRFYDDDDDEYYQ